MARFGLPGNRGEKAHMYYMYGYLDGRIGRPQRDTSRESKAAAKAYRRGYETGTSAKIKGGLDS